MADKSIDAVFIRGGAMLKLYKTLNDSVDQDGVNWFLPKKQEFGKWMPESDGELTRDNGYHLYSSQNLVARLSSEVYEAEFEGDVLKGDGFTLARKVRLTRKLNWNKKVAVMFATDCAERVLPMFEERYPEDIRPRLAIQIARDFVNGSVSEKEMTEVRIAAFSAVKLATSEEAYYAASAAAYSTNWFSPRDAAWHAAQAVAYDAVYGVFLASEKEKEREWQTRRLFEYLYSKGTAQC